MSEKKINIAIDGYSSCGKSTLAKGLSGMLNYVYVDTGAMYRAVSLFAMKEGYISENNFNVDAIKSSLDRVYISFQYNEKTEQTETYLNGENVEEEIRGIEVSNNVSNVSKIKEVREKLVDIQRKMAEQSGVIMDGRDIGSFVLPNAELKIFMTADNEVRVQRRFEELVRKGYEISLEDIRSNIEKRDLADTTRKENPLVQADDAVIIDNTNLTTEEQLNFALRLVHERVS